MRALLDGDIIVYRCGFTTEDIDEEGIVKARLKSIVDEILQAVQADDYTLYLTADGKQGFRYEIAPDYKGQRKQPKPRHFKLIKDTLINEYKTVVGTKLEADDLLAIDMSISEEGTTILCSIDKDALQVPGYHYRWPIMRKGEVVKNEQFIYVDEVEGLRSFYKGLLVGDVADNIVGVQGIGKIGASKHLDPLDNEEDMFTVVRDLYEDDERFLRNGRLMWLFRNEDDDWKKRYEKLKEACSTEKEG
jgi:5'-3' exonuclease